MSDVVKENEETGAEGESEEAAAQASEAENPEVGDRYFRAWFIADDEPYFALALRSGGSIPDKRVFVARRKTPNDGGERIGMNGPIRPIGQRSFLYQHGTELRRIDLPEVTIRPDQVEAATAAAFIWSRTTTSTRWRISAIDAGTVPSTAGAEWAAT